MAQSRRSIWQNIRLGCLLLAGATLVGCGGTTIPNRVLFPIGAPGGVVPPPTVGGSTQTPGGALGAGNDRTPVDPCSEPQARKFVRISMRNLSQDFIHYFLVLIAFVRSDENPTGGVCVSDIPLYTQFGYVEVPAGQQLAVGNYCIVGRALVYIHRGGRFQGATGSASLESAIAPALGTTATFDAFFNSSGAQVPIPDRILFHNPGTQRRPVSFLSINPCNPAVDIGDPNCQQDAFYYVDSGGVLVGSTALGANAARRVPAEIQGTGCQCLGLNTAFQELAPSRISGSNARCNEFFRGGRIDYVFVRDDRDPPYPQLLWRVTDQSGGRVHDFDPRANIR